LSALGQKLNIPTLRMVSKVSEFGSGQQWPEFDSFLGKRIFLVGLSKQKIFLSFYLIKLIKINFFLFILELAKYSMSVKMRKKVYMKEISPQKHQLF
jgi:hypothetical protein